MVSAGGSEPRAMPLASGLRNGSLGESVSGTGLIRAVSSEARSGLLDILAS